MFGWIEFREDEHQQHMSSLHKIKKEVCELIDKMEKGSHDERRHEMPYETDERRGGRMSYRMGGDVNERGGYNNHFPYPKHPHQYPYYEERYNY